MRFFLVVIFLFFRKVFQPISSKLKPSTPVINYFFIQLPNQISTDYSLAFSPRLDIEIEEECFRMYNGMKNRKVKVINFRLSPDNRQVLVDPSSMKYSYSAFNNYGPTTSIWSFLEIFRIIFGQKSKFSKLPCRLLKLAF